MRHPSFEVKPYSMRHAIQNNNLIFRAGDF